MLSLGRWHFYEEGYPAVHAKCGKKDVVEWPEAFDRMMYEPFIKAMVEKQRRRQDRTKMWVLITLVTREPFRRKGAGGLIVEWGIQQALKDGCPAYLEAAPSAVSLYTSFGFRVVEKIKLKLEDFGATGDISLASMAANLQIVTFMAVAMVHHLKSSDDAYSQILISRHLRKGGNAHPVECDGTDFKMGECRTVTLAALLN
jgi:GNAT superfamily N-acetyltransferase